MILILEDDADREAYQRGAVELKLRNIPEEARHPDLRPTTVWISPEAYRKETVLDSLRAKVEALLAYDMKSVGLTQLVKRADVLALLDGSSDERE